MTFMKVVGTNCKLESMLIRILIYVTNVVLEIISNSKVSSHCIISPWCYTMTLSLCLQLLGGLSSRHYIKYFCNYWALIPTKLLANWNFAHSSYRVVLFYHTCIMCSEHGRILHMLALMILLLYTLDVSQ